MTKPIREVTVIAPDRLDRNTRAEFRNVVTTEVEQGARAIRIDCATLRELDPSGLGALITLKSRITAVNGTMTLVGVTPAIRAHLAIRHMLDLFVIETPETRAHSSQETA